MVSSTWIAFGDMGVCVCLCGGENHCVGKMRENVPTMKDVFQSSGMENNIHPFLNCPWKMVLYGEEMYSIVFFYVLDIIFHIPLGHRTLFFISQTPPRVCRRCFYNSTPSSKMALEAAPRVAPMQ